MTRTARWQSSGTEVAVERGDVLLPAGLLEGDEVVILQLRPSILFVPLSSLGSLAAIAVVTLAVAVLAIRVSWLPVAEHQVYTLGAAVAAMRLGWQGLEWWGRLYVLTDRRVLRRAGVLRATVFEAPLRDIQHTSVLQPLRERAVGLGTIGFATAGSEVFDAFWAMIRQPFAVHRTVAETVARYGRH